MPQHSHARLHPCRDCDGFATAAITTGLRNRDGSHVIVFAHCPVCRGTGYTPRRPRPASASSVLVGSKAGAPC
ncbi:hypothetical protein AB0A70_06445 [Streptomyces morookaense]|uniref:hypothetical protein n=1 Tax=Streptomyces morookaense TaxID=1970 RepID=UPI0033C2363E